MQLRKLLVAGAAVAAAAGLTLAPSAQATNPTGSAIQEVWVGNNVSGDFDASLTLKTASVTMDVYGSPVSLGCTSGSASGVVHAGSIAPNTAPSSVYPFMNFDSLSLACDSFFPGSTVTMNVPANGCANITLADDNVHNGTVDTGPKDGKFSVVDGTFKLPAGCEVTVDASPCTIKLGGSTGAQFDENVKSEDPDVQDLILKGNGLEVTQVGFLCLGAVSVGDRVTLNNVRFNVANETGDAIDVRPAP